ncbi:TIGR03086 family metal-binding protein [Nocardia otitidiscaviarum]|uniref:TIGR03086 family metal-binding protein n=1 Tax=Nocardia otitidiscaviarum TaxID=1823 RepID=UPI001894F0D3|nr:TIGR03086 family metal-binding protein [Nocardia otitidiscaviarum]MBF6179206.1 TIGR03086 family protein [Nocardia otitidiscaviarum]
MSDLLRLDATALALIAHDVVTVTDAELDAPTPCTGWTVTDLINHMNERHEAVIASVLPPIGDHADHPRDDFARTAARWVVAMEQTGDVVHLPQRGPLATDSVLSIHLVDMLVHRWDLSRALSRPCPAPDHLTARALPIARSITAPGSPLNGPNGVYHPPVPPHRSLPTMDAIAALLGRDPDWKPE